jgi:hypothetical protein
VARRNIRDWDAKAKMLGHGTMKGLLTNWYIFLRMPPEAIAKRLGVTPRRVKQLLKRYGVSRRRGANKHEAMNDDDV